jgi:hypothetical protein
MGRQASAWRRSGALPSPPRRAQCGCRDPDVVMSDAADLIEVHTLRVVKSSDSHS